MSADTALAPGLCAKQTNTGLRATESGKLMPNRQVLTYRDTLVPRYAWKDVSGNAYVYIGGESENWDKGERFKGEKKRMDWGDGKMRGNHCHSGI